MGLAVGILRRCFRRGEGRPCCGHIGVHFSVDLMAKLWPELRLGLNVGLRPPSISSSGGAC